MIISPQNVTELKTLKPWCSICAIASPARISIRKAKALNQLYAHPTLRNNKKMHSHLQEKRLNEPHFATETSASIMGFSLWSGRFLFTESFWNMLRASDINILQQVLCLFRYRKPLVRLSLTHWLITWFCLIYKISKSSCFLPYPWLQILPCNIKWFGKSFPQNSWSKST